MQGKKMSKQRQQSYVKKTQKSQNLIEMGGRPQSCKISLSTQCIGWDDLRIQGTYIFPDDCEFGF